MTNRFRPSLLAAALLISAAAPAFAQGSAQGSAAPASGATQRPAATGTQAATPAQPGGQVAAPRPATAQQPAAAAQRQARPAAPAGQAQGTTAPSAPRAN
jgi:hypothetical protein